MGLEDQDKNHNQDTPGQESQKTQVPLYFQETWKRMVEGKNPMQSDRPTGKEYTSVGLTLDEIRRMIDEATRKQEHQSQEQRNKLRGKLENLHDTKLNVFAASDEIVVDPRRLPPHSSIERTETGELSLLVPVRNFIRRKEVNGELNVEFSAERFTSGDRDSLLIGQQNQWSAGEALYGRIRIPINTKSKLFVSATGVLAGDLVNFNPEAVMTTVGMTTMFKDGIPLLPGRTIVTGEFGGVHFADGWHKQGFIFALQDVVRDRNYLTTFIFLGAIKSWTLYNYTTFASKKFHLGVGTSKRYIVGIRPKVRWGKGNEVGTTFYRRSGEPGVEVFYGKDF